MRSELLQTVPVQIGNLSPEQIVQFHLMMVMDMIHRFYVQMQSGLQPECLEMYLGHDLIIPEDITPISGGNLIK